MSRISKEEFERLAYERVPFVRYLEARVDDVGEGTASVRLPYRDDFARPGGTTSGPVLMALADFTMWGAVLSLVGRQEMAVTINFNINFLRRPAPGDLVAAAKILKLGRRVAFGEIDIYRDGDAEPVAHATSTYSIPNAEKPVGD